MLRKIKECLEVFSERIVFVSEGKGLGTSGIQPDLLAQVRGTDGVDTRTVVIQICCTNKPAYEVKRAVGLSLIRQIDVVVLIAKNKSARNILREELDDFVDGEGAKGTGIKNEESGMLFAQSGSGTVDGPVVLDFETCAGASYDWAWLVE